MNNENERLFDDWVKFTRLSNRLIKIGIVLFSIALIWFSCSKLNAQTITVGIDAGQSFGHAPVAGLNVGVNFEQFNLRAGFVSHLSTKVNNGFLPYIKAGHTFDLGDVYINAAAGYAYSYKSADKLRMNSSMILFSPEVGYKFTATYYNGESPMAVYLSGMQTYSKERQFKDYTVVTVGVRAFF